MPSSVIVVKTEQLLFTIFHEFHRESAHCCACNEEPVCRLTYNHVKNYCLLFSVFCTLVKRDKDFIMRRYVDDVVSRGECIRWIRFPGILPIGGIVINAPIGMAPQLLARGSIKKAVVPGKLYTSNL